LAGELKRSGINLVTLATTILWTSRTGACGDHEKPGERRIAWIGAGGILMSPQGVLYTIKGKKFAFWGIR